MGRSNRSLCSPFALGFSARASVSLLLPSRDSTASVSVSTAAKAPIALIRERRPASALPHRFELLQLLRDAASLSKITAPSPTSAAKPPETSQHGRGRALAVLYGCREGVAPSTATASQGHADCGSSRTLHRQLARWLLEQPRRCSGSSWLQSRSWSSCRESTFLLLWSLLPRRARGPIR